MTEETKAAEPQDIVYRDTHPLCSNNNGQAIACLLNEDEQKLVTMAAIGEHRALIFVGDTNELNEEGRKLVFPKYTLRSLADMVRYLKAVGALCLDGKGVLRANTHVSSVIRRSRFGNVY